MIEFLIAGGVMGGMGILLAALLAVADKKFYVWEDPRISAAALISGGGKGCSWGCLGLADCMCVCNFDAIHMDAHGLPVVSESKCTACGDCVAICPKGLFELHAVSHRLWVACKNLLNGDQA